MRIVIAVLLSCISLALSANNVKVTIVTVDSLTGENLDNHRVDVSYYFSDKAFYLSVKDSNISTFTLDFEEKQSCGIYVSRHHYIGSEFELTLAPDCTDTTIIVKLLYSFHPRQLPRFLFNKYQSEPDTTNLKEELECLDYLVNRTLKENQLIMQLIGYFSPDENDTNNVLAMKRLHYIRDLAISMGADSNDLKIKLLEYKPYQISYEEEMTDFLKFRDILDEAYLNKLPPHIRTEAEKYNRRIEFMVLSVK
ncbi:MAG: hypothetical protein FWH36_01380 [Lentimicrobiaceae bacterium]|nr:hypothetical protein [Lentimicrobiaceae bacterium]